MKISLRPLLLLLFLAARYAYPANDLPAMSDGDLIFHTSNSSQSLAIQQATGSRYSHMGLIVYRNGKPYVLEAVATVRYTRLADWIARGKNGHYVVKRLKNAGQTLDEKNLTLMFKTAENFVGKPYDTTFEWSDERIYCSELVWKIYKRALDIDIGGLQKLGEFDLESPEVKKKLRERFGGKPPLDEPVISPKAMFDSPLLETIRSVGQESNDKTDSEPGKRLDQKTPVGVVFVPPLCFSWEELARQKQSRILRARRHLLCRKQLFLPDQVEPPI